MNLIDRGPTYIVIVHHIGIVRLEANPPAGIGYSNLSLTRCSTGSHTLWKIQRRESKIFRIILRQNQFSVPFVHQPRRCWPKPYTLSSSVRANHTEAAWLAAPSVVCRYHSSRERPIRLGKHQCAVNAEAYCRAVSVYINAKSGGDDLNGSIGGVTENDVAGHAESGKAGLLRSGTDGPGTKVTEQRHLRTA